MTFFNRKEEVLDIQLTQFGKVLLSRGQFKPVYYAFFDDDVFYDREFVGEVEAQNDIEGRIKETPRLKTQHVFHGIETQIKNDLNAQIDRIQQDETDSLDRNLPKLEIIQPAPDLHYANVAPLGMSDIGNDRAPAWRIDFLKGNTITQVTHLTSSLIPTMKIPQIEVEVKYRSQVVTDPGGLGSFPDETNIAVEKDFLLLEIEELNGFTLNNDFEIEVYDISEINYLEKIGLEMVTRTESLRAQLYFDNSERARFRIRNGILEIINDISQEDELDLFDETFEGQPLSPDLVEYFFDVRVDNGIDRDTFCQFKKVDKKKGIFAQTIANCDEVGEDFDRANIYGVEEEYVDPCEE